MFETLLAHRRDTKPRRSIQRFKPHTLSFSTPRATPRNRGDLPPPPTLRTGDKTPKPVDARRNENPLASQERDRTQEEGDNPRGTADRNAPTRRARPRTQEDADAEYARYLAEEEEDSFEAEQSEFHGERKALLEEHKAEMSRCEHK
ncbi:hypothetical protein AALP_AA6G249800 [Arabis alpina]|uniref:Uncharacterized protein n=1 Tax=Arabis alpina TaxID=50452 RepID=A0A087GRJ1_ARAAL|nr:hypothetical protein AALP_AA6G249800 [Arabis alpina]